MKFLNKAALSGSTSVYSAALVAILVAGGAGTAHAQQAATNECVDTNNDGTCDSAAEIGSNADGSVATQGAIVVTGSRIRRDEFTTAEPVTVVTSREITQAGFNSTTEALQSGAVTGGGAQINNYFAGFVTNGGPGANTVGLRTFGPERTLVLLNGRRLAPAGTRGSVGSADLNVLPTAIIDRIEILKAGASSIYGSDAVAGVINLITDQRVKGLTIEAQVDVPQVGDGVSHRLSTVFGYTGDRFRVSGSIDYFKRERLSRNDVSFTQCPINGFISGPGAPLGSGDFVDPATGQPKCFPLDNGGVTINTIGVTSRTAVPAPGTAPTANGRYNRLRPNAAITTGTPGYEGVDLNSRTTFDPQQEFEELVTPAKILTGFLQAGYDLQMLGDAEAYVELLGTQRKSSAFLYRQLSLDYPVGSPLIPALFATSNLGAPDVTTGGVNIGVRAFIGYGNTNSKQDVDYSRIGGGLRGDLTFFPEWRYDLYASKSFTDATYSQESFLINRLINATTNIVQNANGTFSCAPTAGPGCVPAPFLTPAVIGGELPQAFRDYIVQDTVGKTKFRETTFALNTDGPLFKLPGGRAKLALGAEYRKSRINDTPSLDSQNGNLFNLTTSTPTRGSDSVWEVFGETFLPLLADVPFAYRLNLTLSGRYTEYKSYGGDETYKIAGEYEPFQGFAVRGSYGTSYRAPALFEQFLGATSGFLSNQNDPCNQFGQKTNTALKANCAAEGLAPDFLATSGIAVITAGGAASGLKAETSKNLSVGGVIRPRLPASIGDFSLAVDYFNIKVSNGVSRAGASNILTRCYNSPTDFSTDQGFCRLVSRNPGSKQLTVNNNYVNLATDKVRGIEANLRFARGFGESTKFILNAGAVRYFEQSNKLFPEDPLVDLNGVITAPKWVGDANANLEFGTLDTGRVTFRYGVDWVGSDHSETYKYFEEDPDNTTFYLEVPNYFLHHASLQWENERFELTAGVRNLFNRKPPRVSTTFGFVYNQVGNAPLYSGYDYIGRRFFVNASAKF